MIKINKSNILSFSNPKKKKKKLHENLISEKKYIFILTNNYALNLLDN